MKLAVLSLLVSTTVTGSAFAHAESASAYNLGADIDSRKTSLRSQLGQKTRFEVVDDVFLLASPSGSVGAASIAKRALAAYFNGRFKTKPSRAVAVLLFDSAGPYNAYCRAHGEKKECVSPFGYYGYIDRTIVMNSGPGIGTLTHELVHPLVESGFPSAPTWINEGIASLFEGFTLPKPGEIRGVKNWRHPALLSAFNSKRSLMYASIPVLFGLSDEEFRGEREGLNYATARYFCQWMDAQDKLWPFYQAWRDDFVNDPTGEKAFEKTMGKSTTGANASWASWVKRL